DAEIDPGSSCERTECPLDQGRVSFRLDGSLPQQSGPGKRTLSRDNDSAGIDTLLRAAGRFQIAIGIARVVVVVGERVPMAQEKSDGLDRNGKAQAFSKSDFHVRHAHDFATKVEQRSAAVAGID